MNFFSAAKKAGADLTYNGGGLNTTQLVFQVATVAFLFCYAPIGLTIGVVIGFLAATAYNMCLSDESQNIQTATA